jgi:hypothetical protein
MVLGDLNKFLPYSKSGVPRLVFRNEAGRGVFVESKVEYDISGCSRSSGVERILGKDEVGGSIPPASSRAITNYLNSLKQNNNHHG